MPIVYIEQGSTNTCTYDPKLGRVKKGRVLLRYFRSTGEECGTGEYESYVTRSIRLVCDEVRTMSVHPGQPGRWTAGPILIKIAHQDEWRLIMQPATGMSCPWVTVCCGVNPAVA